MKKQTKNKNNNQKLADIVTWYFWRYNNEQNISLERLIAIKDPLNPPQTLLEKYLTISMKITACIETLWHELTFLEQEVLKAIYDAPCQYIGTITNAASSFGVSERQIRRIRKGAFDKLKKALLKGKKE